MNHNYHVSHGDVIDREGLVAYDHIDDPREARIICAVLNEGLGPAWEDIQDEVHRRLARAKARTKRSP
jgi:hypothetical protein